MKSRIAIVLTLIVLVAAGVALASLFVVKAPPAPPIPAGHAAILIEFDGISTDEYNQVVEFGQSLSKEHSKMLESADGPVPATGDYTAFQGYFGSGYVQLQYEPSHEMPSPDTEKAMREKLDAFAKLKSIDTDDVKLELRYGS